MIKNGGQGGSIRAVEQGDIPGIAALFDAADRADGLFKLASEEDIRESFGDVVSSKSTSVIVASTDVGRVVGVGRVAAEARSNVGERVYYLMLRVDPAARATGLQHEIAGRLAQTACEMERGYSTEVAERVRVVSYVFDKQSSAIEAWERLGLRRVRTGWTMERRLSETLRVEDAPDGFDFRTYRHPEDDQAALEAYNNALADYYDFHPVSPGSWEREMSAVYSRPDLSWLALSGEGSREVVGVAGCQVNESANKETGRLEGWIEGIGVVPAARGKGVGRVLISRCLQSFRDEGLEFALADVDSESVPAVRLFEGAGFKIRIALLQYECALGDICAEIG